MENKICDLISEYYKESFGYYYSFIQGKEYVLRGDIKGETIFEIIYKNDIGNIFLKFLNNQKLILDLLNTTISKINTYSDNNEISIQTKILLDLFELDNEFEKIFSIFHVISFTSFLYVKYVNLNTRKSNLSFKKFIYEELSKFIEDITFIKTEYLYFTNNLNYNLFLDDKILGKEEKDFIFKTNFNYNTQIYFSFQLLDINEEITFSRSKAKEFKFIEYYKITNLLDLLYASLSKSIGAKVIINQCLNCSKYFIPLSRSDEKYCNNISPQNSKKTCKEISSKIFFKEKIKSDRIREAHELIGANYRMKIKRNNDSLSIKNKLLQKYEKYKKQYKKKSELFKEEKITEEEFYKWITEYKSKMKAGELNGNKRTRKKQKI